MEAENYGLGNLLDSIYETRRALSQDLRGHKAGAKAAAIVNVKVTDAEPPSLHEPIRNRAGSNAKS